MRDDVDNMFTTVRCIIVIDIDGDMDMDLVGTDQSAWDVIWLGYQGTTNFTATPMIIMGSIVPADAIEINRASYHIQWIT